MSDEKIWDGINHLERRISTMGKKLDGMSNGCSLSQQNLNQIEALEKKLHDYMEDDSKGKEKWGHQVYEKIDEMKECLEIAANRDKFLSDNDGLIIQEQKKIKKEIAELRDIIQKIGVKTDFTSEESGQALKEIFELKEQLDSLFNSVRFQRIEKMEEILRELLLVFNENYFYDKEWYNKLLEKLDSGGVEYDINDIVQLPNGDIEPRSKPSEPMKDGKIISETLTVKLYEPRDDDLCPICGNFLEPSYFVEYVKKFVVMKREDLQFLYKLIDNELPDYIPKVRDRIIRIKEVYGIE